MKRILFIAALLPTFCFSQLKTRASVDYFIGGYDTKITVERGATSGGGYSYFDNHLGNFSIRTGADYNIRLLTFYFDQTVYMDKGKNITFSPNRADWNVGVKANIGKINISLDHLCIHPIISSDNFYSTVREYGGYNRISIGYGY